jgi:hypothetical protein
MTRSSLLIILFSFTCVFGQSESQAPPVSFSVAIEGLADPDLLPDLNLLINEIKSRGIGFDFESELPSILSNAIKGRRQPEQIAALISACYRVCQECRARAIAPLTKEELKTLMKWGFSPNAVLEEARVRGVASMEISKATADDLLAAGATEELVNLLLPDDRRPTQPPGGDYKAVLIRHAESYSTTAPKGYVKITADFPAQSASEFIFKHNALFVRAIKGDAPSINLDASAFNTPGPRNTPQDLVEFDADIDYLDQKTGRFRGAQASRPAVSFIAADADPEGRNAFRIQMTNKLNRPQRYAITLTWQLRTIPKEAAPGTKP